MANASPRKECLINLKYMFDTGVNGLVGIADTMFYSPNLPDNVTVSREYTLYFVQNKKYILVSDFRNFAITTRKLH